VVEEVGMAEKERRYGQSFRLSPELLEAGQSKGWAQVLRTGRWWDERYGWFEVTREMLDAMVSNFQRERHLLYADYDHGIPMADGTGRALAAGAIEELQVRAGEGQDERGKSRFELWARVEWTERAAAAIRAREYNHTSAWYTTRHVNNQEQDLGPALLGFAITNRPVIDGMAPLALAEGRGAALALSGTFAAFAERVDGTRASEGTMEGKDRGVISHLLGLVGLSYTASDADLQQKVTELTTSQRTLSAEKEREKGRADAAELALANVRRELGLADGADPVVKVKELTAQLSSSQKAGKEQECTALVDRALREHRITPAEKDYVLGNLKREAETVEKVAETPTAKWLSTKGVNPRTTATALGTTAEESLTDEDQELERLAEKHRKEDPDLVELARGGEAGRAQAILLADERASRDLRNRKVAAQTA
jgi:phage I-like protein